GVACDRDRVRGLRLQCSVTLRDGGRVTAALARGELVAVRSALAALQAPLADLGSAADLLEYLRLAPAPRGGEPIRGRARHRDQVRRLTLVARPRAPRAR